MRRSAIPREKFAAALYQYSVERTARAPAAPQAHVTRGDLLVRLGDWEAALGAYREAVRVAPGDPTARGRVETLQRELRR